MTIHCEHKKEIAQLSHKVAIDTSGGGWRFHDYLAEIHCNSLAIPYDINEHLEQRKKGNISPIRNRT